MNTILPWPLNFKPHVTLLKRILKVWSDIDKYLKDVRHGRQSLIEHVPRNKACLRRSGVTTPADGIKMQRHRLSLLGIFWYKNPKFVVIASLTVFSLGKARKAWRYIHYIIDILCQPLLDWAGPLRTVWEERLHTVVQLNLVVQFGIKYLDDVDNDYRQVSTYVNILLSNM